MVLAPLLLILAGAARADCSAMNQDMACGRVTEQDVREVYQLLMTYSGYDNTPDDQKPWGKPKRAPTTPIFNNALMRKAGSPAVALAANTGLNNAKSNPSSHDSSHVVIDAGALSEFCQNRAQVAFILGHEIAHLEEHDPEKVEKHDMDLFDHWYEANGAAYADKTPDQVASAWARDDQDQRAAFQRGLEHSADDEARVWVHMVTDPKTGQPFDADAGEQALDAAEKWLKAKGEKTDQDPMHGTLVERVARLRAQRLRDERLSAGKTRMGAVEAGASGL